MFKTIKTNHGGLPDPGDALKCKFCGGNINAESGICPFCDTQYMLDPEKLVPKVVLYADDKIVEVIY